MGRGITERLLARGDEVVVLARGSYPDLEARGARMVRAALTEAEAVAAACAGRDVVFHVAAQAGIWGPFETFYQSNVVGTRNVLAGVRAHRVPRLVYTSSPSVTFDGTDAVNADERLTYPSHFENAYSATKAEAEQAVLAAAQRGDVAATAMRPHLIWGPGDPHLIPRVVKAARAGRLVQVGDGTNKVDITYVENVVDAHLLAGDALHAGHPANGRAYFVSNGEPVALWPWINGLLERLGIPVVKRRISVGTARRIGTAMEAAYRWLDLPGEPRMTRFLAAQLGTSHWYDISALRRDLGYTPRVGLDEGFEALVAWLKAKGI